MADHARCALTIAAIATPPGTGGVGIVRASGPLVPSWCATWLGRKPKPRLAHHVILRDEQARVLDEGLLLYFPKPRSYTGEDVMEFQGHGGPVVLQSVLSYWIRQGAVEAEPGEFTLRAFLNGKMDLTQAESVASLIHAVSEEAAQAALESLAGGLSQPIALLKQRILSLRAQLEAQLDFSDDVGESDDHWEDQAQSIAHELDSLIQAAQSSVPYQQGFRLAILGPPNVGKSTLINALSRTRSALVSDRPGTTRDVIRAHAVLGGMPVQILDTAGFRDTSDPLESMGIQWALEAIQHVDHHLWLYTCDEEKAAWSALCHARQHPSDDGAKWTFVRSKIDTTQDGPFCHASDQGVCTLGLSAQTGEGLELLSRRIQDVLHRQGEKPRFLANARHVQCLQQAQAALLCACNANALEVALDSLYWVQRHLGAVVGDVSTEDMLGEIFSKFCIGK